MTAGPLFEPRRCTVCGVALKDRQRRCCSRRCALRAGFTPQSLAARAQLQRALETVPASVRDGSIDAARRFKDVHHRATTALHRRAGWRLCEFWLAEIGKAAAP